MRLKRFEGWCAFAISIAFASVPLRAAVQTATWNGGAGNWTTAANWSDNVVPNNNATDQFEVAIDGGNAAVSDVTLTQTSSQLTTINKLAIDTADQLQLNGGTLNVLNEIALSGSATVASGSLRPGAGTIISGNGTVNLNGPAAILGGPPSYTIGSGVTVRGVGSVGSGATWTNQGHILADQLSPTAGEPGLKVRAQGMTNTGTIEVTSNAILAFDGTYNPANLGTVVNNGGALQLAGVANLAGGTFNTGGADWHLTGTVMNGTVQTSAGSKIIAGGNSFTTRVIDNITLNGTMELTGNSLIQLKNSLTGNGELILGPTVSPFWHDILISATPANTPFVIGSGITVRGGSAFFAPDGTGYLTNHGTIQADPGHLINFENGWTTNDGTFRIAANGKIVASELTFDGGHLDVDLGGSGAQALLQVDSLDLSGTDDFLDLTQLTGDATTQYEIVKYNFRSGVFDHVTPGFFVDYSTPGKIIVSVPEPSAGLLISALPLTALARRRVRRIA